jgi:hypothetical protein
MMTKLLTVLVALFAISLSANAQTDITGTYTGVITVSMDGSTVSDVPISLTQEAGGTYAFSLKDFSFMGIAVGDIDLTGVTGVEEAGVVTLSREGSIAGPTVPLMGIEIPTTISLTSASVVENQLSFVLNVSAMGGAVPVTDVTFTGEKTTTGIQVIQTAGKALVVYPTLAKEVINVQGAGRYAIYGQNGSTVKSGVIGKGEINVSSLPAGLYFITVDGKTAKFIKQYH